MLSDKKEMTNMQNTLGSILCQARDLIIAMPLWTMALVTFLMRLFIPHHIGALFALIVGTVWCLGNVGRIRDFARKVVGR